MLKIKQLSIKGINGITDLNLIFNPGLNFISGKNGVGKTTILECIASSFNRHKSNVRTKVSSNESYWNIVIDQENTTLIEEFNIINNFNDTDNNENHNTRKRYENAVKSREIINFSIERTSHKKLYYMNNLDSIQSWIYKNYYIENRLSEKKYFNLKIIQECFNKLDPNIFYSRVEKINKDVSFSNNKLFAEIYLKTPQGEIPLDYLSSGYKSCFTILLGIIKQVEVSKTSGDINTFKGVILIDELDLHLHPEWQYKLIDLLKWLVPEAQIIATTHSPHIIQIAEPGEIMPLGIDDYNRVFLRDLPDSTNYGFQGWTIEEILTDVMGLTSSRSEVFSKYIDMFYESLMFGDADSSRKLYKELSSMIHPSNPLAKILSIQAGETTLWKESENDSTY